MLVMKNHDINPLVNEMHSGSVELIDIMPNPSSGVTPELAVVNAARVSYLGESKGEEKDSKLLLYLLNHKHTSPFEHVIFKFKVSAPVVVWWQWVRHRTWSFNFQSGRYIEFDDEAFYEPKEWRLQSSSNKQGSDGVVEESLNEDIQNAFSDHVQSSFNLYQYALRNGVAKEQARMFLPGFAMMYTAIATIDAHNLMGFLRLRLAREAQFEIRMYANKLLEYFEHFMPVTAKWFKESK